VKDPSQVPKGVKVQRGKKGGYFYETSAVKPGKKLSLPDKFKLIHEGKPEHLNEFVDDKNPRIREEVAKKIDQKGLHQLINDENQWVRRVVVQRIDRDGLLQLEDDADAYIHETANDRLAGFNIRDQKTNFLKTGDLKIDSHTAEIIKDIDGEYVTSDRLINVMDILYEGTDYEAFHKNSREEWLNSSSSELSALLKDSVMRQFSGEIQYHKGVSPDEWDDYTSELYNKYPKDVVDKYVILQKKLTKQLLDVRYPDTNTISVYRGTSAAETDLKDKETTDVKQNPLSSWTTKKDVAINFAVRTDDGIVLDADVGKDDIWSCFLTHSYKGNEEEMILLGGNVHKATVERRIKKVVI